MRYQISIEGRNFEIEITPDGQVWVNGQPLDVDIEGIDGLPLYSLLVDHRSYEAHVEAEENGYHQVLVSGRSYQASLQSLQQTPTDKTDRQYVLGPTEISAPLPGWLVEMRTSEGEHLEEGDVVAVVESMKMHLELRTPCAGVVRAICVNAGQEVAQGELLAIIDNFSDDEMKE